MVVEGFAIGVAVVVVRCLRGEETFFVGVVDADVGAPSVCVEGGHHEALLVLGVTMGEFVWSGLCEVGAVVAVSRRHLVARVL